MTDIITTEEKIFTWLEKQARQSHTGISFDYVPKVEDSPKGFRFMRRAYIGQPHKTLKEAILAEMKLAGEQL